MSSAPPSTTHQRDVDAREIFGLFGIIFPFYQKMHPHSMNPKVGPFHNFELDADDGEYDEDTDEDSDNHERSKVQQGKKLNQNHLCRYLIWIPMFYLCFL